VEVDVPLAPTAAQTLRNEAQIDEQRAEAWECSARLKKRAADLVDELGDDIIEFVQILGEVVGI